MTLKNRIVVTVAAAAAIAIAAIATAAAAHTPSEREIEMIAKAVWGEARGCSPEEQKLIAWTIFNRVDSEGFGNTISAVLTEPGQFAGYKDSNVLDPKIYALCRNEAAAWALGATPPTLAPYATVADYKFFGGDGRNNWFRGDYRRSRP